MMLKSGHVVLLMNSSQYELMLNSNHVVLKYYSSHEKIDVKKKLN